jgi:hypothetical protein
VLCSPSPAASSRQSRRPRCSGLWPNYHQMFRPDNFVFGQTAAVGSSTDRIHGACLVDIFSWLQMHENGTGNITSAGGLNENNRTAEEVSKQRIPPNLIVIHVYALELTIRITVLGACGHCRVWVPGRVPRSNPSVATCRDSAGPGSCRGYLKRLGRALGVAVELG